MFHDEAFAPPTVSPGVLAAEGEKALQRAVALAEARKEPSFVQIADVRTQLGDWYQVFGQPERALPQYVQAWHAAKKVTAQAAGKPLTTLLFGEPALLHFVRPEGWDRYAKRKPDEMEVRSVSTLFTVDAEGRPQGDQGHRRFRRCKARPEDRASPARRALPSALRQRQACADTRHGFYTTLDVAGGAATRGGGAGEAERRQSQRLNVVPVTAAVVAGFPRAPVPHPAATTRAQWPARGIPPRASRPHLASRAGSPPARLHRPCPGTTKPPACHTR